MGATRRSRRREYEKLTENNGGDTVNRLWQVAVSWVVTGTRWTGEITGVAPHGCWIDFSGSRRTHTHLLNAYEPTCL